jgi:hypothetical protein
MCDDRTIDGHPGGTQTLDALRFLGSDGGRLGNTRNLEEACQATMEDTSGGASSETRSFMVYHQHSGLVQVHIAAKAPSNHIEHVFARLLP